MKNIQVIDGAVNCVYDVFAASDEDHALLFPGDSDIAFAEDFESHPDVARISQALERIWANRVSKPLVVGIHGTLFYQLAEKRQYYPTRRDEEARNPDGTKLRRYVGQTRRMGATSDCSNPGAIVIRAGANVVAGLSRSGWIDPWVEHQPGLLRVRPRA